MTKKFISGMKSEKEQNVELTKIKARFIVEIKVSIGSEINIEIEM